MKSNNPKPRAASSVFAALLLLVATCFTTAGEGKAAPQRNHRTKKSAPRSTRARAKSTSHRASSKTSKRQSHARAKSTTRHTSSKRRGAPRSSKARLALLHLGPQRVEEIQQALIREGYLKDSATGNWDESTREAMRRYQQSNGFSATGLPDAKSLMKLGLGPHPLPQDVKQSAAAQASIQPPAKPNP